MRKPEWFRRFGEIPGVRYQGDPKVDRGRLPGHDLTPELHAFEMGGQVRYSLWWPDETGGTTASPVSSRAFGDLRSAATKDILRNLHEGLELPGEPTDYHFLIQGGATELWQRRRDDPGILDEVERLCWLDIGLVESRSDAASFEAEGEEEELRFYGISTFGILIDLYEREGFLREALEVARRATRCGQGDALEKELANRVAAVEAEDDG